MESYKTGLISFILKNIGFRNITLKTVSYTHLDVYKRQLTDNLSDWSLDNLIYTVFKIFFNTALECERS